MKRLIMLAALTLLATVPAHAQSTARLGEADIPYHFSVGGKSLPPGHYVFERLSSPSAVVVLVRGAGTGERVIVTATAAPARRPAERGKLVLKRGGGGYFLAQIWTAGEPYRLDLRPPRAGRATRGDGPRHHEIALAFTSADERRRQVRRR